MRSVKGRDRGAPIAAFAALTLMVASSALSACSAAPSASYRSPTPSSSQPPPTASSTSVAPLPSVAAPPSTTVAPPPLPSLGARGSARFDPDAVAMPAPAPARLTIPSIAVRDAPVTAVGVEANGDMEIPGPREVGWYRYGSVPQAPGSTVLAAHIAFNGVDGVFRRLDRLDPGAEIVVTLDDGRPVSYVVTERVRLAKDALPIGVFATTGASQLVLITCGGAFNPRLRSYEDNVIVYASPV